MRKSSGSLSESVTIRDVAKLAETSIATVSYVLNDQRDRYLRPELRERVLQAATELGYVKNAAASSLKGKRRGILAVLVAQFGNSFFTRMCVDIEAVARQEGYIVTICNSDDDPLQERLILERLIAQRIDGCIITPAMSEGENVGLLGRHQVPFVVLERPLKQDTPYDFVGHDNFQSGYLATKTLLDAGHRDIAFLGWDSPIPNIWDRVEGYKAALREYGLPLEKQQVLLDELSQEAGRRMAERLILDNVSAVVLGHHESAKGVLLHFQKKGVRWPDRISVVLTGTPEWNGMLSPTLTCIKRPEQEMGRAAASALLDKLRDPGAQVRQQVFLCSLLQGESIKSR